MELILWRHAEAEPGEPDLGRKLTAKGEKQARRVAEWLQTRLPQTAKIYVSPARRAQQTAQAFVNELEQIFVRALKRNDVAERLLDDTQQSIERKRELLFDQHSQDSKRLPPQRERILLAGGFLADTE